MRCLFLLPLCLSTVCLGQTFDEYLAQRKKFGITQAVGIQTLETLIGTRTIEVKGVVKGVSSGTSHSFLLLEKTDGDFLTVQASKVPEWLAGNEVPVRLIVKATRSGELDEIQAQLYSAAPEARVAAHDREVAARMAKTQPKPGAGVKPPKGRDWNLAPSSATPIYAGFIKKRNKRLSDAMATHIAEGIIGFSLRYGVDARLIMAMLIVESNFNPTAVSSAGAMGLGQLMPGTARGMGVGNAFDAHENLYGTVRLIRGHINKYQQKTGNDFDGLILALAAYNAGSGAVRKHNGVPPYRETQAYIRKVISYYDQLRGRR
ncbi:MAG TPA: lytic transglycosylase domain-containing protein [Fimbriimonadaceae bacterium]|nr:lytic transglycosylase domain-containing protein [Fimbriimonadaceae bacterium]